MDRVNSPQRQYGNHSDDLMPHFQSVPLSSRWRDRIVRGDSEPSGKADSDGVPLERVACNESALAPMARPEEADEREVQMIHKGVSAARSLGIPEETWAELIFSETSPRFACAPLVDC
jgi:hypothetical protein